MSQKDVWQKHMGPLKTQVGEADAATSPKTTREKVSPIEKTTYNKRNHKEQVCNLLERKFLESLAASPEYVNTKRILGLRDWKQFTCA